MVQFLTVWHCVRIRDAIFCVVAFGFGHTISRIATSLSHQRGPVAVQSLFVGSAPDLLTYINDRRCGLRFCYIRWPFSLKGCATLVLFQPITSPALQPSTMVRPGQKALSLVYTLVASQYLLYSHAALLNSTVDDAGPDPVTGEVIVYSSNAGWNPNSVCDGCWVRLDSTKVYNRTWHDATYDIAFPRISMPQNATFKFTGLYLL